MQLNTDCKHFLWKKRELVSMNKINQDTLNEPSCELNKLTKTLSCPKNCSDYEKE